MARARWDVPSLSFPAAVLLLVPRRGNRSGSGAARDPVLGMLMRSPWPFVRVKVPSLVRVGCAVRWVLHRSHLQNSEPITPATVSVGTLVKLIRTTIRSVAKRPPPRNAFQPTEMRCCPVFLTALPHLTSAYTRDESNQSGHDPSRFFHDVRFTSAVARLSGREYLVTHFSACPCNFARS